MRQKSLLVTFDAWKTLFTPRTAIAAQYARVAREHGVVAKETDISKNFKQAFESLSAKYPNYGKQSGMKSEEWWTAVIEATFSPSTLPPSLAPALMSHFAGASAYRLHPSATFLLHSLRANVLYSNTVIGVISNGDERVPSVLQDLGVAIRDHGLRDAGGSRTEGQNGIIDFVTLSYDIGIQKPDPKIFDVSFAKAKEMCNGQKLEWDRVHIGDDIEKDFKAAEQAGWRGILWDGKARPIDVLEEVLGKA